MTTPFTGFVKGADQVIRVYDNDVVIGALAQTTEVGCWKLVVRIPMTLTISLQTFSPYETMIIIENMFQLAASSSKVMTNDKMETPTSIVAWVNMLNYTTEQAVDEIRRVNNIVQDNPLATQDYLNQFLL